ncbi:hypothetical protein GSH19_05155 [Lactobacillus sp. S2-2]|uniref:hypothetical protein n=1 Tax=Lactobacillus sp. S2-2 TaxID=2692917 RepID=UPI001F25A18D|nr:hypothetical protein [Lactobacillus sp. S2-2]MCF6515540.1 hypothetical protein [Lactobacillus sp. S2-2]
MNDIFTACWETIKKCWNGLKKLFPSKNKNNDNVTFIKIDGGKNNTISDNHFHYKSENKQK